MAGVPQGKRGDIWWFLVEQHRLKHPELTKKVPEVEYTELLKQLTTHQHAILIDLGKSIKLVWLFLFIYCRSWLPI